MIEANYYGPFADDESGDFAFSGTVTGQNLTEMCKALTELQGENAGFQFASIDDAQANVFNDVVGPLPQMFFDLVESKKDLYEDAIYDELFDRAASNCETHGLFVYSDCGGIIISRSLEDEWSEEGLRLRRERAVSVDRFIANMFLQFDAIKNGLSGIAARGGGDTPKT